MATRLRKTVQSHRVDQHVGEKIRLRRLELGLTQEQLAHALDVSYQQIQKYETGANRISVGRAWEIARSLQVDITYLFAGLETDVPLPGLGEHGGRHRAAIDMARRFPKLDDPDVRAAIAGLVKTLVDRQRGP